MPPKLAVKKTKPVTGPPQKRLPQGYRPRRRECVGVDLRTTRSSTHLLARCGWGYWSGRALNKFFNCTLTPGLPYIECVGQLENDQAVAVPYVSSRSIGAVEFASFRGDAKRRDNLCPHVTGHTNIFTAPSRRTTVACGNRKLSHNMSLSVILSGFWILPGSDHRASVVWRRGQLITLTRPALTLNLYVVLTDAIRSRPFDPRRGRLSPPHPIL
ncbi:hypothetical protein B0H17DRAFT_1148696 [Mycena rosella]|uniref:Uncharacterized protein n=1 Tax=Mycena rosella TaxID=1033263 RepID=A0AAD7C9F1_MYCRO|nr:hypothetical protein B0H17DRAFT_1148696 [Mycena rosella]